MPSMKLIGVDESLLSELEQTCPGASRAWMSEVRRAAWNSPGEMLRHFPRCQALGGCRFHFPLLPDDSGLSANVIFSDPPSEGCVLVTGFVAAPTLSTAPASQRRQRSTLKTNTCQTPTV